MNSSESAINISLVISDAEKAGGYFYSEETGKRFPFDPYDPAKIKKSLITLLPGEKFSIKKEFGGDPMTFTFFKNSEINDDFKIKLAYDPEWEWALRANIYLEAGKDVGLKE
jgi:hypothetical protein